MGRHRRARGAHGGQRRAVRLARTGCTTSTDHHYVFPATVATCWRRRSRRRARSGSGSTRAGLDGRSAAPPVACRRTRWWRTGTRCGRLRRRRGRWHDPSPGSMLRIGWPRARRLVTRRADARRPPSWPRPRPAAAHAPGGDAGRGGSSAGPVRLLAAGLRGQPGWTGPTCGSRHAVPSGRRRRETHRGHRDERGALPVVQRPPRGSASARSAACARRCAGRPGGGRGGHNGPAACWRRSGTRLLFARARGGPRR